MKRVSVKAGQMKKISKQIALLIGVLSASLNVEGQEILTSKSFAMWKLIPPSLWRDAGNPALLRASGLTNYAV